MSLFSRSSTILVNKFGEVFWNLIFENYYIIKSIRIFICFVKTVKSSLMMSITKKYSNYVFYINIVYFVNNCFHNIKCVIRFSWTIWKDHTDVLWFCFKNFTISFNVILMIYWVCIFWIINKLILLAEKYYFV